MAQISNFFQSFLVLTSLLSLTYGDNVYTELEVLKPQQREALASFKNLMLPSLPHDYMKEDIYLIKFLSYNDFNIKKAQQQLTETLKWRQETQIDEAAKNEPEYIAALQKDFPIFVDGYDKEGRPVCEVPIGAWPIRKAATAGLTKKVTFHMFLNCAEKASAKIREQQALGKNVSDYVFIGNMEGFNVAEHGCPSCLPLAINLATGVEKHYPKLAHGFWLVNSSPEVQTVLRLIRPLQSPSTRAAFKTFSGREEDWKPFLEERINLSELSDFLGGVKKRNS